MPHWLIKSGVQRLISLLPASHKWNTFFQQHVTRSLDLARARFEMRLDHCRKHLETMSESRRTQSDGFNALELGTGWFPVVPIGLFLCGARKVSTFDIAPLLNAERLEETVLRFGEYGRSGELKKFLPHLIPERLPQLNALSRLVDSATPQDLLGKINIHLHVRDASSTGLAPRSIDLFVSSGVLEYIPRPVLKSILHEFKSLSAPGAVQSHYLNLVDQYSYFDPSITPFNFLQYSERRWKYLNSPLTWQNRLRISDYRELLAEGGYQIVREENTVGQLEDLEKIRLSPEFSKYSKADLLVILSWIVAKVAGNPINNPEPSL